MKLDKGNHFTVSLLRILNIFGHKGKFYKAAWGPAVKSVDSGVTLMWGQALALLLTGCVTLRELFNLSKAQFLTYKMVIITKLYYNNVKIK